jgi:hypothetical protein
VLLGCSAQEPESLRWLDLLALGQGFPRTEGLQPQRYYRFLLEQEV